MSTYDDWRKIGRAPFGDREPEPEPAGRCRECGTTLTEQEGGLCSVCYRHLTEPHD